MASSNLVFRDLTRYVLRILPAAAVVAMLTGTAYAQSPLMPRFSLGEGPRKLSPEEQQKKDELDNAYKQATTKIPDKQLDDPWATVRPTGFLSKSAPRTSVWGPLRGRGEMVDARDLKSLGSNFPCRFKSGRPHQ